MARVGVLGGPCDLPHAVFEPLGAVRKSLLLRRPAARTIRRIAAARHRAGVTGQLTLRVGELPRLELQLTKGATAIVRLRPPHPLLQVAQPFRGAIAAGARFLRMLPAKLVGRPLHFLRDLPEIPIGLPATVAPLLTLRALALLALTALPSRALPALLTLTLLALRALPLVRPFLSPLTLLCLRALLQLP